MPNVTRHRTITPTIERLVIAISPAPRTSGRIATVTCSVSSGKVGLAECHRRVTGAQVADGHLAEMTQRPQEHGSDEADQQPDPHRGANADQRCQAARDHREM